ncbi:MAG TPA: diaminopropionate ammonia-lyase, partial [Candidatus Limiplasma stercoravium]|nr:diaminopropionate ammonia-lyase [Candidatus Limiplasma stercoravium]
ARQLGQKAVVRMPRGSAQSRFDNIAREGAQVSVEDANYDECVRLAAAQAVQTPHGVIVQDTAWEGYEDIPAWIMQGYGTMAAEAVEQLAAQGIRPTHVLVQAGVGSLAGAVTGYLAQVYASAPPFVAVLEASAADCLYRSAAASDGRLRAVGGDLRTIMAGLACGEGNPLGWDILRDHASAFLSCPDWVSALGMRMLAAPLPGDPPVLSGESGAVGMGVLGALEAYPALREALGLDAHAQVLLFSTEGDTDPDAYRRIVWGGECPATTD